MTSGNELHVLHAGKPVGHIARGGAGGLVFTYAESWLADARAFALATSLPLSDAPSETAYFRNLLPEGGARARIARAAGISEENDFELLRLYGRDCAGSLEVIDPDEKTPTHREPHLLTERDGSALGTAAGFAAYFKPETGLRLSLAGAQPKLAVIKTDTGIAVPLDGRPSTHILKIPNPDFKGLVENEAITLSAARALGLPVVGHDVIELGPTRLLLVDRYDRVVESGVVNRLHQQDICQALGYPPDIKYEREGGPSLADVFELVRGEVDNPLADARALLRWVVFNVVVHNADAHAKNLSLVGRPGQRQSLAPFYDLVCTGAYGSALDHRLAMRVGDQFDPGSISRRSWQEFAEAVGIGSRQVTDTVRELAERAADAVRDAARELRSRVGTVPRLQQLQTTVTKRAKKALELLET